jgi:predicted Zn-dependent peptidase
MSVLSTAFGGGMSSRLFQEIREKRGMAYSVYSYSQSYADNGMFGIYVGCLPGKVESVLQVCRDELGALVATGLTDDEISRAKGQVRGATVLGQEDTGARMTRIAKSELHQEPLLSIGQLLDRVDEVTGDDIRELARDLLDLEPSLALIGPFSESTRFSAMA